MNEERRRYENALAPMRARLTASRFAAQILSPAAALDHLERFMIEMTSRGVGVAEPTEEWIESAGTECILTGMPDLGRSLKRHATHESGKHMLLIADTHALVARRRRQGRSMQPAGILLGRPSTPAIRRVIRLHEETIAGPTPHAEVAILFEIERLWAVHGLTLAARCREILGRDSESCLTFLEEHTRLESTSARFLATALDSLLTSRPESERALVAAGASAIDAYSAFFDECLDGALVLAGRGSGTMESAPSSPRTGTSDGSDGPKSPRHMASRPTRPPTHTVL